MKLQRLFCVFKQTMTIRVDITNFKRGCLKMGENCRKLNEEELSELLNAPFLVDQVKWRATAFKNNDGVWSALLVPYVQNKAIMNRLDQVFGKFGWENQLKELHGGVICGISVHFEGRTITKWDGADPTDTEATKGGITNSMKRASVQWGIGRYLKDVPHNWVKIHSNRLTDRDEYVNNKKNNVTGFFTPPSLPQWAIPCEMKNEPNNPNSLTNNKTTNLLEGARLLEKIREMENVIGFSTNPEYIPRIFNKATGGNITHTSEIDSVSLKELEAYFKVLKPVSQLCVAMDNYGWKLDQLLFHAQVVLPKIKVDSIFSLFFNISSEDAKKIVFQAKTELNVKNQIA
ncbi:hypothetical protein FVO58_26070 [Metabacillus halosaccharovorans]|nr:hypothetical protein [Metabacillus halosaccharovorans]